MASTKWGGRRNVDRQKMDKKSRQNVEKRNVVQPNWGEPLCTFILEMYTLERALLIKCGEFGWLSLIRVEMNNTSATFEHFLIKMEARTVPVLGLDILLATISIRAIDMTLGYLKSKPPGLQSPIDQVNTYLLRSLQSVSLSCTAIHILVDCTWDIGDTLARILMWPFFMSGEIFIMFLIINTVCYQLLSVYPYLIEKDFNTPMAICLALGITSQTVLILVFESQGLKPLTYYTLRRMFVPKSDTMVIYRRTAKAMALALLVIMRLVLWFKKKHHHNDLKVISDKSLLFALSFMVGNSLISKVWFGLDQYTLEKIACFIIVLGWPITTCLLNQNVRSYAKDQIATDINVFCENWIYFVNYIKQKKLKLRSYFGLSNSVHTVNV